MLSPISCNIEFKVWKICQTNSPGDSLSPFHRYKITSKRICTTCVPQNPSLQGPATGMREFSVSSTTELNRSLFTDENEQRSGPPSILLSGESTMQTVNGARCSGETTALSIWGRGGSVSTLIYSQFCSIWCPLKPNADHSWQTLKCFDAESPVPTNRRIFCHGQLPFIPSHRPSFMDYIPEENRWGKLKNLEQ